MHIGILYPLLWILWLFKPLCMYSTNFHNIINICIFQSMVEIIHILHVTCKMFEVSKRLVKNQIFIYVKHSLIYFMHIRILMTTFTRWAWHSISYAVLWNNVRLLFTLNVLAHFSWQWKCFYEPWFCPWGKIPISTHCMSMEKMLKVALHQQNNPLCFSNELHERVIKWLNTFFIPLRIFTFFYNETLSSSKCQGYILEKMSKWIWVNVNTESLSSVITNV